MKYFINGEEVTADTYNRECDDNFNCGIRFDEDITDDTCTMTYKEYED